MKEHLAAEVDEFIDGIVLLKVPDQFAWTLYIESKDAASIGEYALIINRIVDADRDDRGLRFRDAQAVCSTVPFMPSDEYDPSILRIYGCSTGRRQRRG